MRICLQKIKNLITEKFDISAMSEQQDSVQGDPYQNTTPFTNITTNQDTPLHEYVCQEYQVSPHQQLTFPQQPEPDHFLVSTQGNYPQISLPLYSGSGANPHPPSYDPSHQIATVSQQQQQPIMTSYNIGYMTSSGHGYQMAAGNSSYQPPSWGCTLPADNPRQCKFF